MRQGEVGWVPNRLTTQTSGVENTMEIVLPGYDDYRRAETGLGYWIVPRIWVPTDSVRMNGR